MQPELLTGCAVFRKHLLKIKCLPSLLGLHRLACLVQSEAGCNLPDKLDVHVSWTGLGLHGSIIN